MNPANRLGGVAAVTVVTFLSLAGVVLGAAFIVDNTRSDDYVDMETVEAIVGEDYAVNGERYSGDPFGFVIPSDLDEIDPLFGFRTERWYDEDWVEIEPDSRYRDYSEEENDPFFRGNDWLDEDWVEIKPHDYRFYGYVVPRYEFGNFDGTVDELMDYLFANDEGFMWDELDPEFEESFRERIERILERFESDEFYLYEYGEEDDD